MPNLLLSIGTNQGNLYQNLQTAVNHIRMQVGQIQSISKIYLTKALDFDGNDFYNIALSVQTDLSPNAVLIQTQQIEKLMGRETKSTNKVYSNRIIDIDILFYDDIILKTKDLTIPHPEIQNRNFVLIPLSEIAPDFFHPVLQKSIKELVLLSPDNSPVKTSDLVLKNIADIPFNFIAVEGNIGAGKTTFSTQFAKDFNAKLVLERFEENAFLPKFYEDQKRYAFPLEMSFLADRYQQLTDDLAQYDLFKTSVISDYYVFKSLIFSKVTLSDEEYNLYRKIFNIMYKDLVKPDLYVYLYQNVDRLLQNIKKRGRDYEKSITGNYLEQIHEGYMDFIKSQKDLNILILDISDIDFVQQPEYYRQMIQLILTHPQEKGQMLIKKL